RSSTPSVNGLTPTLIERNPNSSKPFRIDRTQAYTCDQDHEYTAEQRARDGGLMDQFPRFDAQPPANPRQFCHKSSTGQWDIVMGYFDGNTVTALWNDAQHFALGDNSFARMSGQSTRGALNLTAGDTYGVLCGPSSSVYGSVPECGAPASSSDTPAPTNGQLGTFVDDTDPYWDVCSTGKPAALTGRNIGDLLTPAGAPRGPLRGGGGGGGWVPGGSRRNRRWHVLTESSAGGVRPGGGNRSPDRSAPLPGLRASSQPVPVLPVDGKSSTPAADVGDNGGP